MNERRRLLLAGGLATMAAASGRVYASPSGARKYTIGVLWGDGPDDTAKTAAYRSFKAALARRGYVEGKNLSIESRFAEGRRERFASDAAALVERKVDVLLATGTPSTQAAQKATPRIPIVAVNVTSPVMHGFAVSLGRPGKNVTGITNSSVDTGIKRWQILARLAPNARRLGVILNPDNPAHMSANVEARAAAVSFEAVRILIRAPEDADRELEACKGRVDALSVSQDYGVLNPLMPRFASFALAQRYPSAAQLASYVESGGLTSYGQSMGEQWRLASEYVVKILDGANPGELPFVEASEFELCFNRRTATAIGVTIPPDLLLSADLVVG